MTRSWNAAVSPPIPSGSADADVIARVLAGDTAAFQLLVTRYQEPLFRIAYSMVRDSDVASDLVQDAFVRAYVNLARCRKRDRFRVWLITLLRNRVFDHLKEKRRRDLSLTDEHVLRRAEAHPAHTPEPDDRHTLRALMDDALAKLSEPLREAFVLRHVEQLSIAEVAELLGTGVSAVKMRLQRARDQLQRSVTAGLGARDGT